MTEPPAAAREPDDTEHAAWQQIVADLTSDPLFDVLGTQEPAPEPDELRHDDFTLADEGTFTPPEPPPIPRPDDVVARFAWAAALGGPALLVISYVLSLGDFIAGVAVLLAIAGFITLVARKRDRSPDEQWGEDHFGDGAVR